ncbi:hypothetical protein, partial [Streptomyces luteosporeus]|uniref:hypothetical protein n=1 Tax=Streptomyces luteosporeus TaxID=173856 RepID=UPI0031D6F436
ANLDVAFDDSGRQINPLTARLTGNVVGVMKVFNRCGWQAEPESVRLIDNRVLLAYLYGAFCLVMEINAIIDFRPFCFYK